MPWYPNLECTLTLKRIYNESVQRRNYFQAEYDMLSSSSYRPEDGEKVHKRLRFLKENLIRFQDRAQKSIYEIGMRKFHSG